MGMKTLGRFVTDTASPVTIGANGNVVFTTIKTSGNGISCDSDGNITITCPGVYAISASFTTTSVAIGTEQIQMYADGVAVSGAHAFQSATAAGDLENMAFSYLLTVKRCCMVDGKELCFKSIPETSLSVACVTIGKVA